MRFMILVAASTGRITDACMHVELMYICSYHSIHIFSMSICTRQLASLICIKPP